MNKTKLEKEGQQELVMFWFFSGNGDKIRRLFQVSTAFHWHFQVSKTPENLDCINHFRMVATGLPLLTRE